MGEPPAGTSLSAAAAATQPSYRERARGGRTSKRLLDQLSQEEETATQCDPRSRELDGLKVSFSKSTARELLAMIKSKGW
jgi:hypothetical protein